MTSNSSDPTWARDLNRASWNAERYDAWVSAMGSPEVEARTLVADPAYKLRRLLPHLGEVAGQRICSIQGSNGRVAVALACSKIVPPNLANESVVLTMPTAKPPVI